MRSLQGHTPEEVLRGYFHAKDESRPMLLDEVFAPNAELVIHNDSPNIAFPAVTRGRSSIAQVLVRDFSLAYENVYSFYLRRPVGGVQEFVSPWLVGMSERATGQPRVGGGIYTWSFDPDPPNLATKLVIRIDVMQVLPESMFDDVFAWLQALEYPWLSVPQALQSIPTHEALCPIAAFLAAASPIAERSVMRM
jgi:hypothetical protein